MKKFLLKLSLFLALCAAAFVGAVALIFVRTNEFEYKFPADKHVLFIGHSHIEVGVNPALVPESINWARSADSFHTCAARLELALRDNPQIDTVFLAVAPFNFKKNVDAGFGSERECGFHAMQYFRIFGLRKSWNIWGFGFVKVILKNPMKLAVRLLKTQEAQKKSLGGFFDHRVRNLEKDIRYGFQKRTRNKTKNPRYSGEGILYGYFRKMVDMCKARKIRVIALDMPLYQAEKYYDMPYFYKTFQEYFPDVEMWDYANWECADENRADINHLNRWGAEIFSRELAERMTREGIIRVPAE